MEHCAIDLGGRISQVCFRPRYAASLCADGNGSRTKLINNVRGWLRGQGLRVRSGATRTFSASFSTLFPFAPVQFTFMPASVFSIFSTLAPV